MTTDDTTREEIEALEDACLGIALSIDKQTPDPSEQDRQTPLQSDPFTSIIMNVMELRTRELAGDEHHSELDDIWGTLHEKLGLPDGAFEAMAQRGGRLGSQLRKPPSQDDSESDLVALAETESGRTIWGVNADGWDDDAFEGENVTLGMKADGTIEPVELAPDETTGANDESDTENTP